MTTIKKILQTRGIQYLCHFTRIENLDSILTHGLIPRNGLYNKKFNNNSDLITISGIFNDEIRLDNHEDATCLSISFPNSKMFYKYRQQSNAQWAVIVLDANVLIDKDCAFYPTNAACNSINDNPIEAFQGPNALENLFDETEEEREGLLLKDPTDVQAEVLVFNKIEPKYIVGCAFSSKSITDDYRRRYPSLNIQFISYQDFWGPFDDRSYARRNHF